MPAKLLPMARDGQMREVMDLEVHDLAVLGKDSNEMALLQQSGYQPDDWKAYIQFKANFSLPNIAGPLQSGNYTGYHPKVIANSYGSFLHQQVNIGHLVKSYAPKQISQDRIVGCIVGVQFPANNWDKIPDTKQAAPCVTFTAAIFKQAQGVSKILGNHLTSREVQAVSIEVVFSIAEAGIYIPSEKRLVAVADADEELWAAVTRDKNGVIKFGKYKGEQIVVCPGGINGRYAAQGVGLTPTPAERIAEIVDVKASRMELADGMLALCAEHASMAMFQKGVKWRTPSGVTVAKVLEVHTSGEVKVGLDRRTATPENPLLVTETQGRMKVLRSLQSVVVL